MTKKGDCGDGKNSVILHPEIRKGRPLPPLFSVGRELEGDKI